MKHILISFLLNSFLISSKLLIDDESVYGKIRYTYDCADFYSLIKTYPSICHLLDRGQSYTVFVPSNKAIKLILSEIDLSNIRKNIQKYEILQNTIKKHIIVGNYDLKDIKNGVGVTLLHDKANLDSFNVIKIIQATNGKILIIDRFLK